MATKEEILDAIGSMTVLELSELLKDFEEKFDVTAAAPAVAVAAAPGAGDAGGVSSVQTQNQSVVTGVGQAADVRVTLRDRSGERRGD